MSPAVDAVPKPITYSLVSPTADVGCDDGTGNGITAASIAAFSVRFPSLSCSVTSGTTGRGRATIDWSDGTESTATAVATLEGALNGTVELRVVSGHFEGASTTTWFVATPLEGECFGSGITRESIEIGALALTPR